MLLSLRIENFALIDYLELELGLGLNVFTGETGAGKSIILDAVDAILGGKTDRRAIRTGATRALLEATFEVNAFTAKWITQQDIDLIDETLVICSREISQTQDKTRNRFRINGILVSRKLIDQLRDRLLEITAQGQTVQLLAADAQKEWLDLYGGTAITHACKRTATLHEQKQQAKAILENRRQLEQHRLQRLDILQYQVQELNSAQLTEADELDVLQQEQQRLSHVVELQQQSYQVYQALYQREDGLAAADLLSQAEATLTNLVEYDFQLQPILGMIEEALSQVTEAGRQIGSYGEQLESDPQRLQDVETRIQELKQLCRKYGQTLAEVITHARQIRAELEDLQDSEQSLDALDQAYHQAQSQLQQACEELTDLRREAANQLETNLVQELKPLAMDKVKFQVNLIPTAPTPSGGDQVQFCFSPNPGEPLQPLSETASGGEMSRFLLALKACFSQVEGSETMIFDEIDVGVSGKVAGAIAQKLHQLSQQHQVLCVTHQPIVAAMGDRHFHVRKDVIVDGTTADDPQDQERTVVRVNCLSEMQRREELAQLASGQSAVQEVIAFADTLLSQANALRQQPIQGNASGSQGAGSRSKASEESSTKSPRSKSSARASGKSSKSPRSKSKP
ncbi:MAG: DNA repair protein RecN [Oscillatoriales cyanobacterium RM2_1_1]|nr:DNA repair protein RecN [Oscillatoriales cyanobacterium SM2_3_0]NJO45788.1 DNA repair protein RecN [Oscillatoriales cyanobacterium RM2_1_1]